MACFNPVVLSRFEIFFIVSKYSQICDVEIFPIMLLNVNFFVSFIKLLQFRGLFIAL